MSGIKFEIFVILFTFSNLHCAKLPDLFPKCNPKDQNFDDCVRKAIHTIFDMVGSKGLPALKVPSVDPVDVTKIDIGSGSTSVNLVQHYTNAKVFGFSKQEITKAHFDLDNKVLTFTSTHDVIRQESHYTVNGKVLLLPVTGDGDSIINFDNVTVDHTIKFEEELKKGKKYLKIVDYTINVSVKKGSYEFKNLFNGDKALGDSINKVINENWNVIFEDVKVGVERAYSAILKDFGQRIFARVPIDEMFLN